MAKKKQNIPSYGTAEINGVTYFRTRITDADGKRVPIYASTCEELYKKEPVSYTHLTLPTNSIV